MTNRQPPVEIIPSPAFIRRIKKLVKSYPRIRSDLEPLLQDLSRGETPGDQIQSTGYTVYKVRLANRDAQRGKSGGYRLIYYVHLPDRIVLLTIYAKSERTDISIDEIKTLIENLPDL